jgi:hypothetical protein
MVDARLARYCRTTLSLLSALAITAMIAACQPRAEPAALDDIAFNIMPSQRVAYVGETVTFTSDIANTLGRDAEIKWETTGGVMDILEQDSAAQIEFDEPGEYIISADLYVDGDRIRSDSEKVIIRDIE